MLSKAQEKLLRGNNETIYIRTAQGKFSIEEYEKKIIKEIKD